MKVLLFVFLMGMGSTHAFFMNECKNTNLRQGEVIGFNFTSCIDNNFWDVETRLDGVRFDKCRNAFRGSVSPFYVNCINDNFSDVAFKLPSAFIRHCFQFDRDALEPRFIDCINENFENIEDELRWGRR